MTGDLARYRYLSTVGAGGMARVDLAEDTLLGRQVALKRISGPADPRGLSRLRREALAGASLSHPNLVSIYDVVTSDDGHLVVVMEYIAGGTLRDELNRRHKLPPDETLRVLEGVAAGLDAIHRRGIVHRDVKPSNILLGDGGVVKVADLGIAAVPDRTRITTSGSVVGSLSYMAPEQLDASPSTPAIDIYALAAVAYEMLSGEKARREANAVTLAHAIATQSPPNLRNVWPEAPPGVADLLVRGMARDPAQRPRSAGELVRRLRAALAPEDTAPVVVPDAALSGADAVTRRHQVPAAGTSPPGRAVGRGGRSSPPAVGDSGPSRSSAATDGRSSSRRAATAAGLAGAAAGAAAADGAAGRIGTRSHIPRQEDRFGLAGAAGRGRDGRARGRLMIAGLLALVAVGVVLAIVLGSSGSGSHAPPRATTAAQSHRTTAAGHKHASGTRSHRSTSSATSAGRTTAASSAPATTPARATSTAAAQSTTPSSSSVSASNSKHSTPPAPAPASAGSPVHAVESFYGAAAAHNYAAAWALADPTLRSELQGYQSFRAGQAGDRSITFNSAKVVNQSSRAATVAVQTTSVRDDGTQHCAGTVDLVPGGAGGQWQLHLIHITC